MSVTHELLFASSVAASRAVLVLLSFCGGLILEYATQERQGLPPIPGKQFPGGQGWVLTFQTRYPFSSAEFLSIQKKTRALEGKWNLE